MEKRIYQVAACYIILAILLKFPRGKENIMWQQREDPVLYSGDED